MSGGHAITLESPDMYSRFVVFIGNKLSKKEKEYIYTCAGQVLRLSMK